MVLAEQIMDTPGVLSRPDGERNEMEALTLASMQHLPTAVIFVMDLSGHSGHLSSIDNQVGTVHEGGRFFMPLFVLLLLLDWTEMTVVRRARLEMTDGASDGRVCCFFSAKMEHPLSLSRAAMAVLPRMVRGIGHFKFGGKLVCPAPPVCPHMRFSAHAAYRRDFENSVIILLGRISVPPFAHQTSLSFVFCVRARVWSRCKSDTS